MAKKKKKRPVHDAEERELLESRRYGFFWYDWIWRILRPILVFTCSFVIICGLVYTGWQKVDDMFFSPMDSADGQTVAFSVKSGSSLSAVSRNLEEAGLIHNHTVFKYMADFMGMGQKIQSGDYELSRAMSATEILDQLISGDGTNQNLTGIFTTGNFTPHGATTADLPAKNATLFDLILFAKTKVEKAFFRPNIILLNPVNWSQMLMEKNASGDYYLGHPASVAPKTLWGLPIWTTPAIPQGKFMVGDFTQAATLWTRQGMTVELFEQDVDNVQKNLVTIRAERRLGFGIERVSALVGGDLALPAAASATGK